MKSLLSLSFILVAATLTAAEPETLPPLQDGKAPSNFSEMWAGFDPRVEPLEVEVLHEWEEDGVVLRVVRIRIGVFKGKVAKLAAIYGFPQSASDTKERLPGLLQVHGGGQYADHKACLTNAQRGYATVSIAWAGRISSPEYRVTPAEVQLFWEGKTDDPNYRLTTDWGAVDGYHAPGRNAGNQFPSAMPAAWTLDAVESPRNSGWFLCALSARRALTFLEQQPEVDPRRLGVYGHSMGGKLTVLTSVDERVKAAAPSCGGISDRYNSSPLFNATLGDDVSLREISCPIFFLSPSNDFHGRIGDLPDAVHEIQSKDWRVTCSPHHNHQDTPEYEVATQLWFDQHLKGTFSVPQAPRAKLQLETNDGVPQLVVKPDTSREILSIDVFYTQHGKPNEQPEDREDTMHRFWHCVSPKKINGEWTAALPLTSTDKPLWVYANVLYKLDEPITGAGYYYGIYTADSFNLSSVMNVASPDELQAANVSAAQMPSRLIENFEGEWQKEWFSYGRSEWSLMTHKLRDATWAAPEGARLAFDVKSESPNKLVVLLDDYAAVIELSGGSDWQHVELTLNDIRNYAEESLPNWNSVRLLKLTAAEHLRPARGQQGELRVVGAHWKGEPPVFQNLRWQTAE